MPSRVHLDLHDVGLVGEKRRHGAGVGRRLGDDHVARVDQRLADEVDHLLAAGRDEHLVRVDASCPPPPSPRRCSAWPPRGPPSARTGAPARRTRAATGRISAAYISGGNVEVSGRPPASEITSGALGQRHQVAHRRGLHDLRARGEQRGVALEVARGRTGGRAGLPACVYRHAGLFGGPWTPVALSSCGHASGRMRSSRHLPRPRPSPRSCPRCWPARSPRGRRPRLRRTDFAFLESRCGCSPRRRRRLLVAATSAAGPRPRDRPVAAPTGRHGVGVGALLFGGALADEATRWPGPVAGIAVRGAGQAAARGLLRRASGAARRRGAAALPVYADGAVARARAACRFSCRPVSLRRARGSSPGCCWRPPARGREVRGPAHPAVTRRRGEARARGDRRAAPRDAGARRRAGRAPALERDHGARRLRRRLRRRLPLRDARVRRSIATGAGPDAHRIPGMNWYSREEARYVEYGSSFRASRRFGDPALADRHVYNMNRAHLSRPTPTVFERLDDAGVRTAGTTYLIYRGRHRHSRPARRRSRASRRGRVPPRRVGPARVLLRRPVRHPPDRLPAQLGLPGLATRTRVRRGATWWSGTCSTSCCSRCRTTTPARTGNGPHSQVDSRRRRPSARAAHASRRRDARVPGGTCGDRAGRPRPHLGRGQHLPARRV